MYEEIVGEFVGQAVLLILFYRCTKKLWGSLWGRLSLLYCFPPYTKKMWGRLFEVSGGGGSNESHAIVAPYSRINQWSYVGMDTG